MAGPTSFEASAPFNFALGTLEKIHNILVKITNISALYSIESDMSEAEAQHIKYNLVRQLFIQATPLYNKEKHKTWKSDTYKELKKIKEELKFVQQFNQGKLIGHRALFDPIINDKLDDITIEVQEKLQEEGYFMPSKKDPRFMFKQGY